MEDLLNLSDYLTVDEKLIQETVNRFVEDEVIELMPSCFEKGEFPESLIEKIAQLGLFGMTLPAAYGGAEASYVAYGLACQELERGDSGLRSFVSVQSSLCMFPLFSFGTSSQKEKFLKPMAEGKLIGCFGLTEPDAGSNPAEMKTQAKKVSGGWVLNGAKMWITNATIARLAIVWARDEKGIIRGFIVERDFKGFETNEIKHKLSLRASITGEIVLEDCFVPEENYLPGTEVGISAALKCLSKARYGIAWGALGAAMACYEKALEYTKERKQFGKPIASFQLVQSELVNMAVEIIKGQLLNLQLGRLMDKQQDHFVMVSMAKMNACKQALKIARAARNLLGANGITLDYHVIRHMNNLESVFTYEGTDHMHQLIIGKYLTGLDAFQ